MKLLPLVITIRDERAVSSDVCTGFPMLTSIKESADSIIENILVGSTFCNDAAKIKRSTKLKELNERLKVFQHGSIWLWSCPGKCYGTVKVYEPSDNGTLN